MLANLDNEVYFKKVFTDVEVFTAFVKDVLGIEMHIDKVETEKVLPSKVSAIKFKMDLFAEDTASRTVVEIQKVDYDYSYDRFTHYFIGNLIDVQRSSKTYNFAKEVYIIVVVTSAYRISDKTGKPIKDDVLVTDVNPRTLQGEIRDMYNHKMVILNTTHVDEKTPPEIRDWLDLIIQSMQNPDHPNINILKPAIAKAAKLAEFDDISPEQLAEAKIQEMRKEAMAYYENENRKQLVEAEKQLVEAEKKVDEAEEKINQAEEKANQAEEKANQAEVKAAEAEEKVISVIKKALEQAKLSKEEIADLFGVTVAYVEMVGSKD